MNRQALIEWLKQEIESSEKLIAREEAASRDATLIAQWWFGRMAYEKLLSEIEKGVFE